MPKTGKCKSTSVTMLHGRFSLNRFHQLKFSNIRIFSFFTMLRSISNAPCSCRTLLLLLHEEVKSTSPPRDTGRAYRTCSVKEEGFPGGLDSEESACNTGDLGQEDPLEEGMTTQ